MTAASITSSISKARSHISDLRKGQFLRKRLTIKIGWAILDLVERRTR